MYNYSKLLGRIKEKGYTQESFARKMCINPSTLSQKLKGKSEFTQKQMKKSSEILDFKLSEIVDYFFICWLWFYKEI